MVTCAEAAGLTAQHLCSNTMMKLYDKHLNCIGKNYVLFIIRFFFYSKTMNNYNSGDKNPLFLPDWFSTPISKPRLLYESGKTITEIARIIGCDRRTAARLIKENLDISDIGKWHSENTKLYRYIGLIRSCIDTEMRKHSSLLSFSKYLFHRLKKEGYTGSERTIRNYLRRQERVYMYFQSKRNQGGLYVESNKH